MKRRNFFQKIALGTAAVVAAPHVLAEEVENLPSVTFEHPKAMLKLQPIHDNVVIDKEFYKAFLVGREFNRGTSCISDSGRLHVHWTTMYDKNYDMFTTDEDIRVSDWVVLHGEGEFIYCRVTNVLYRHDLPDGVKLYMSKWEEVENGHI